MDIILPAYRLEDNPQLVIHQRQDLEQFMRSQQSAHSHNYYILSFLYKGTLEHLSDLTHESVTAPAILLLDVNQIHTHPDMSGCSLVSMAFAAEFIADQNQRFLDNINRLFSRPFISISETEMSRIDEIIKIMARENSKDGNTDELRKALLNVLVIQCLNLSELYPAQGHRTNATYTAFRSLLKDNFNQQHQVTFYARRLNVSTRTLTQCVRAATHKTPKELIDEHLLLEAKRLLYWSEKSGKEVAWQLGFETDSYFNRFIKKHTGHTPKAFQKKRFPE